MASERRRLTANDRRHITLSSATGCVLKQGHWLYSIPLFWVSSVAHAHGEDVLTSIYAEIISIVLCLAFLFLRKDVKQYRAVGFTACGIGVIVENWALADVPYSQYQSIVTSLGFSVPLLATFSAVYLSKLIANRKK